MGENSKIEWTDHTFNPWIGCQPVSHGCDRCYAEAMMAIRWGKVEWGPHGERKKTSPAYWRQPARWNAAALAAGVRHRVFCASLGDWLDNKVPPVWRSELCALIKATPALDWLLLTKRPENLAKMVPPWRDLGCPDNVWLGVSIESPEYWYRYDYLSNMECRVRFISYEPALGPLMVAAHATSARPLPSWIIAGGESGPKARDADPQWFRDAMVECNRLGIPFFMKQMHRKGPIPDDLMVREFPGR